MSLHIYLAKLKQENESQTNPEEFNQVILFTGSRQVRTTGKLSNTSSRIDGIKYSQEGRDPYGLWGLSL